MTKGLTAASILGLACLAVSNPAWAQSRAESVKNFRRYPNGEWLQEARRTDPAGSSAPVVTSKGCKSPSDPADLLAVSKMSAALSSICKMVKITDTERVYEFEQTCQTGMNQVMRITGRAIDDKVMTIDSRLHVQGAPDTVTHTTLTFTGKSCAKAPKPSAADCATLAGASSGEDVCAGAPASYRAQCETQVAAAHTMTEAMLERCK